MSTNLSTLIVDTLLCQAVARGNVMNTKGTGTPKRKGIRDKHHTSDAQSHPPAMRSEQRNGGWPHVPILLRPVRESAPC
jgi:hypothetical protein